MKLGLIGLGKMGMNLALNMQDNGLFGSWYPLAKQQLVSLIN